MDFFVARIRRIAWKPAIVWITLTLEGYDYHFWPEGRKVASEVVVHRSDGATADWGVNGSTERKIETRKVSLPNGDIFSIADKVSEYVKWPTVTTEQIAAGKERLLHPPQDCIFVPGQTVVGHETILGHPVVVISRQLVPGERSIIWRAPDLSCEILGVRVETLSQGSYKLKAETKAVKLVIGEPDPSLFEIPATYSSVKPSDMFRKEYERIGVPWDEAAQRSADRSDARFFGRPLLRSGPAGLSSINHPQGN